MRCSRRCRWNGGHALLRPACAHPISPRNACSKSNSRCTVSWINSLFSYIGLTDVFDIVVTSVLIYYALLLIRGTRAVQIITGFFVVAALLGLANLLHLYLLGAILQFLVLGGAVALGVVFQPELRRALEQIGRGGLLH